MEWVWTINKFYEWQNKIRLNALKNIRIKCTKIIIKEEYYMILFDLLFNCAIIIIWKQFILFNYYY